MFIRRALLTLALGALGVPSASGQDFGGPEIAPGNPPQLTETHTVESGDTLWDLCSKYLNSPWYWPKIWSYNPQLTNPHWIFPGNEISFYPSDENLPTQIAASTTIEAEIDEDLDIPGELGADELVTTVGSPARPPRVRPECRGLHRFRPRSSARAAISRLREAKAARGVSPAARSDSQPPPDASTSENNRTWARGLGRSTPLARPEDSAVGCWWFPGPSRIPGLRPASRFFVRGRRS